jgi:hypothetical protein
MIDHAGPVTVNPPTFGKKSKFTFMAVDPKSVFDVLEACLVADVLIPVVDAKEGVSPEGVKLASTIKAQGLMTGLWVLFFVFGLSKLLNSFACDHWNGKCCKQFASRNEKGIAARFDVLVSKCVSGSSC